MEFHDIVVKSDNEPAMVAVIDRVAKLRAASGGGRFVPENSVTGDSQSNGLIERAVQSVEGMIRVMKSALEIRWGAAIPAGHPIIA